MDLPNNRSDSKAKIKASEEIKDDSLKNSQISEDMSLSLEDIKKNKYLL